MMRISEAEEDRASSQHPGRITLDERISLWVRLSRPKFLLVGILPFVLGNVLAQFYGHHTSWEILVLGTGAVLLIMLVTYYLGEYFDYESDSGNVAFNAYSGGSRVLQTGKINRTSPLIAALLLLAPIFAIGLTLQFYYDCGPFTILLGSLGLAAGVFYSAKPIQWAYHGLGEPLIAVCYGWLTVNTAYYLQTGQFNLAGTLVSLPIMTSIAAVILVNEYPDLDADKAAGKRNLVVIIGKRLGVVVYRPLLLATLVFSFLTAVCPFSFPYFLLPLVLVPVVLKSLLEAHLLLSGNARSIERLCANTVLLNLLVILLPLVSMLYELMRRVASRVLP